MRVIVSAHTGGPWEDISRITWPAMKSYAERHGCKFLGLVLQPSCRPASWQKLRCIAEAFVTSEEVLWLDADVAVADESISVFDVVAKDSHHAASVLKDVEGTVHHNMGVWLLRRQMLPYIVEAAMDDECVWHPWWEQAALNKQIAAGLPTHSLGEEWNHWKGSPASITPRFRHACGIRDQHERLSFLKDSLK